MGKIHVTKAFLPPLDEYKSYVDKIWSDGQLTNNGPILKEAENGVSNYLGVKNLQFVTNGTLALQLALRALDITGGEVITTPFSYVATTSAILWERCRPVFVDIDSKTFNIDPLKIEAAITKKTKAILAVHVFGNPCDIETIQKIANKHNLKVIYDAAHAFGVKYKGKSVLEYGDISTCSFHATKIFHTIEGGCVVTKDDVVDEKINLLKRFGHFGDDHQQLGINAKMSEMQAAMGLCNLKYVTEIIEERRRLTKMYDKYLSYKILKQKMSQNAKHNNAYYPVVLATEGHVVSVMNKLKDAEIFPRRYFYPSLNTLPYLPRKDECPIAENISKRILCLPLFIGLDTITIRKICEVINSEASSIDQKK